jgi:hypothetical protein
MASPKIPWQRLWQCLWKMIPAPLTDDRLLLALDDYINPKTGKKIFGCGKVFDHAAKQNRVLPVSMRSLKFFTTVANYWIFTFDWVNQLRG